MKSLINIFTVLLCVFGLTAAYGQNTQTDTVFVKRTVGENEFEIDTLLIPGGRSSQQVLAGTTFLPYSDKMVKLLNQGLSPISLEIIKDCDNTTDPSNFKDFPKFREVKRDADELLIDVSVIANCCHNFLGEAEVVGQDTLNLVYTSYGGFCSCKCAFTLRFRFDTTMEDQHQILKYITINSSKTAAPIPAND